MPERIPFLSIGDDYAEVREDVARRFASVLDSQHFVLGPQTEELESSLAALTGASHAVACGSGTAALSLALAAHGIGAGDAVIVPSLTFVATGAAVARSGAVPVFADVDPGTLNLGAAELRACLERSFEKAAGAFRVRGSGAVLRAVMPVHLFGRAADMKGVGRVAREADIAVIEDAAQAVGAADTEGVGAWGEAGCFSFYPTKNLGAAGDAGIVTTCDAGTAARLRSLRVHGASTVDGEFSGVGFNARIDELQAAYLNAKLPRLSAWTRRRGEIAARYDDRLRDAEAEGRLATPGGAAPPAHVYHQYAVRIASQAGEPVRDRVADALQAAGIETRVFYRVPLHRQPCFRGFASASSCPAAESAADELLSLPVYPSLSDESVDRVADALIAAAAAGARS
jgi:dTDP-4-amino-4,6-dideoxygalactose transaminase